MGHAAHSFWWSKRLQHARPQKIADWELIICSSKNIYGPMTIALPLGAPWAAPNNSQPSTQIQTDSAWRCAVVRAGDACHGLLDTAAAERKVQHPCTCEDRRAPCNGLHVFTTVHKTSASLIAMRPCTSCLTVLRCCPSIRAYTCIHPGRKEGVDSSGQGRQ